MGQIEVKFTDFSQDSSTVSATGGMAGQLFTIPEGDGQSDRHGRKIQLKSVRWKGVCTIVGSTQSAEATDTIRLMLVKDKSANGVIPAVTDILTTANWESFENLENMSRFKILIDKTYSLNSLGFAGNGTASDTLPVEKNFDLYRKLDIPIEYNDSATTGVISTINTNNVVMLLITRLANAGIESCIRFRYTDM